MPTRRSVLAAGAALFAAPARAADYGEALSQAIGALLNPYAANALALSFVAYEQRRADALLTEVGLARGSVAQRLRELAQDPRWLFPADEAGRKEAVAQMNAALARLRPRLAEAFGDLALPRAEVRRPAAADEARGGYREPPVYYVDLRNIGSRPAWTLPTVAFHETLPGHALQAAVTGAVARPRAFPEAWAIYAEKLAADLGVYRDDPRGMLGFLHWRLFRLARVVADTGMGADDWSAEEAVAAMRDIQGFDVAFVTMEADAARMRAQPGLYAAQGVGALMLEHGRPEDRTMWPAFHRAMLADARWSFDMLDMPEEEGPR